MKRKDDESAEDARANRTDDATGERWKAEKPEQRGETTKTKMMTTTIKRREKRRRSRREERPE